MTQLRHLPLILEPEELQPLLGHSELLILDLCRGDLYSRAHVPGAIHIEPSRLMRREEPAMGKCPTPEQLLQLFRDIGYTGQEHIVVYDDEGGGWAGRMIWTLDLIQHPHYSYLNGGMLAWLDSGLATEQAANQPSSSTVELEFDFSPLVSREALQAQLGNDDLVIWDARSEAEYRGEKVMALRGGHIPGAINYEWTRAMDRNRQLRIRDDLLPELEALGIARNKRIVTHCQSHHRSGFTYLLGKALGYESIQAYDGSWSEWGNLPDTPIDC
ncbi:sulfurtransferase [Aestuariirhabdus sp. Z084]|uniref:rhodanese-like domain-containing protein n=1 Tax=Aestuariirhabdus haliotis TaxID=2918751 RepID=UPI00201B37CD|nr:rhodanese-like domain-containing protein [Aestuariirhabdus haliotis]MCL6415625.1 sulfurtransferase [Aestuariirhabdus haliotis]MCL6419620.1 sulfurtransferase [Aestuariirhabdus haliotis]